MGVHHHKRNIVTDGLIFNVDAGNKISYIDQASTCRDVSGFRQGTLTNMNLANQNDVFDFDGVNDYINFNSLLPTITNDTQGTIEAWVKPIGSSPNAVFSVSDYSTNALVLMQLITGGIIRFLGVNNIAGLAFDHRTSTDLWQDGVYLHIVMVQNGVNEDKKIYVNGQSVSVSQDGIADRTWWMNNMTEPDNCLVGATNRFTGGGLASFFSGQIGVLRYYNRALTASEVKQNFESQKGRI